MAAPIMGMFIVTLLGGGMFGGGVLGLPPGERDEAFVQCPPKDVPVYVEWAERAEGKPGAKGIDGLAADPEVLAFIAALEKGINTAIERNAGPSEEEKVLGDNLPPMIKILLNRSGCLYLDVDAKAALQLMANPPELPRFTPPFVGMLPAAKATLVVNGGDQAETIAKHLEALMQLLPPGSRVEKLQHQKFPIPLEGASLTLHRHKDYFILGWGKETVDAAVKGLKGESQGLKDNPRFLAGMEKVALERTGSVAWLDVKSLIDKAVQGLGPQGLVVAAVVQQLGADSIESLALCTGVVDGQVHSRGFLKTGGKTEGILALAAGRPLTAKDFQNVPDDADLVLGFTLDAPKILATTRKLIANAGEEPKENFEQVLAQLESELGVSFEDDLFKAFGQRWLLYDSPSNGGILFTAPVVGLEVLDHGKAQTVFAQLMSVLKQGLPPLDDGRFRRGMMLSKKSFLDHEIYYVHSVGREQPFAPAFTLTKTHLLAAPHPQQLKAHLRFLESDQGRFAAKFDEKVSHAGGELFAVCYTRPELAARYLATASPMFASMVFADVQRGMPGFDTFDFPSARAFLPYFSEGLITKERTEDGILWNCRHGIPIPGLSSFVLTMPSFLFWSLGGARRVPRALPAAPQSRTKPPLRKRIFKSLSSHPNARWKPFAKRKCTAARLLDTSMKPRKHGGLTFNRFAPCSPCLRG